MKWNRSFFLKFVLAAVLGLAVLIGFNLLNVSPLNVPLCLAIVIMGISLHQSPSLVVAISLVYILLVTYSQFYFLYHFHVPYLPFPNPVFHPMFALVQRVGLFLVVCAAAIYMSFYRKSSEWMLADIRNTLSKLPIPVVISNAENIIIFANESLYASLGYTVDLTGKRYTIYFMPYVREEQAVGRYNELFGAAVNSVYEIDFTPFGSSVQMRARLTCLGAGSERILITVLQPPDGALRPLATAANG